MSIILALWRLRHEDCEFEASLGYIYTQVPGKPELHGKTFSQSKVKINLKIKDKIKREDMSREDS